MKSPILAEKSKTRGSETSSVKMGRTRSSPNRNKTKKNQSNKKNVPHTVVVVAPSENANVQHPMITSKCELVKTSVEEAVAAAFKAFKLTLQKTKGGQLFDNEPHPVNLLVSAIKISNSDAQPFRVKLLNPFLNEECDICLIVKDLEKGWKVDHEPTTHHYRELLEGKNVSFITEVMPLRQLRIEFKPFEARGKLAKRFEVVLVDKRVAKFIPRYLGKAFYQAGKLPISIDIEADDLLTEVNRALATSMMSMSNHGASTQMQVGLSNQTEKQIVENIMAVYETMQKQFPGKFANIRSLYIRFGNNPWTVPIYVSFATRDSVTLPVSKKLDNPLIDDLSTLAPGWKVAVYPSGEVKKVKDEGYQQTVLDAAIEVFEAPGTAVELDDDEEMSDAEVDEKITKNKKSSKAPSTVKTTSKVEASDVEEDKPKNGDKSLKISRKKKPADDSSEDEGDALEEEYMKELDILEGDLVGGDAEDVEENEEVKEKEVKKADNKLKQIKKKTFKKSNIKKKPNIHK